MPSPTEALRRAIDNPRTPPFALPGVVETICTERDGYGQGVGAARLEVIQELTKELGNGCPDWVRRWLSDQVPRLLRERQGRLW